MTTPIPVTIHISDAVTLYAIQTKRFKTSRLSIYTMMPADEIDAPLSTLLFGVLRRGSEKYPRLSLLNRRLDDLYGTTLTLRNFLRGNDHVLSFTAEMLSDVYALEGEHPHILEGTLELMAEMLLHPIREETGLLPTETVESEKRAMMDSIRAEINDTRSYAATRLRQIMCEGEPFGLSLSGSLPMMEKVTSETLTRLLDQRLNSACWEVYYVGSEHPEQVADAFKHAFASFAPQTLVLSEHPPHIPPMIPRRVEESFPVGQGKLCMAWSSGITDTISSHGNDYPAAVVLCELLGIMQSSLLFRRVREELGLCYFCDTAFEGKQGILSVTVGIHPQNRENAEAEILSVMEEIREGKLSEEDLNLAKLSLENSYRQLPDSPAAMESYWFWQDHRRMLLPTEQLSRLMAVTCADVVRAARKFILDTVYFLNATKPEEVDEDDG